MILCTLEPVEFRKVKSSISKSDPNKTNYYYTFEDDDQYFQLFSRENFSDLKKGDMVNLYFHTRLWDNRLNYDLEDIKKV